MEPLNLTTASSPRYTAPRQRFGTPFPLLRLDQSGLEQGIERQALTPLAPLTASDKGRRARLPAHAFCSHFFRVPSGLGRWISAQAGLQYACRQPLANASQSL